MKLSMNASSVCMAGLALTCMTSAYVGLGVLKPENKWGRRVCMGLATLSGFATAALAFSVFSKKSFFEMFTAQKKQDVLSPENFHRYDLTGSKALTAAQIAAIITANALIDGTLD